MTELAKNRRVPYDELYKLFSGESRYFLCLERFLTVVSQIRAILCQGQKQACRDDLPSPHGLLRRFVSRSVSPSY